MVDLHHDHHEFDQHEEFGAEEMLINPHYIVTMKSIGILVMMGEILPIPR